MKKISAALKIKFPQVDEKKFEDDAITATRQLKDCYRKKKKQPQVVEENLEGDAVNLKLFFSFQYFPF